MLRKLALLGLALSAASGGARADALNIALDGYCNTFALKVHAYRMTGTRGGCGYTVIEGGTAAMLGGVHYDIPSDFDQTGLMNTWYFTLPVDGKGSWRLYQSNGEFSTSSLEGTYTVTDELAALRGATPAARDATAR